MSRMTRKNLRNIKRTFEEKTGVDLNPDRQVHTHSMARKLAVLAAVIVFCLVVPGCTQVLFSPLHEDELSLRGTYLGSGIVSVEVTNGSSKNLTFQEQLKLICWSTSEEVEPLDGQVRFENTRIPAHSTGTMTIDLSDAYDIAALEAGPPEVYYFLLTNNDFLFGYDWMCSFRFREKQEEPEETEPVEQAAAEGLETIEEELRFYFEEAYAGAPLGLNDANFTYQQKVEEVLTRRGVTVTPALSPTIMVGGPSEFLDPEPTLTKPPEGVVFDDSIPEDQQYLLAVSRWTYCDAYGRMVAGASEKALVVDATIPQRQGERDGGITLPLVFLFVYDAQAASDPENCVFLYGHILTFAQMEQYKVLEDEHYAVYDATDLIYTDVDAYLDYFLTTRQDIYCDDQIRQRVHAVYAYYHDKAHVREVYTYLELP